MQGKIMAYSAADSAGIIKGEDNKPYTFSIKDWVSQDQQPENELLVEFSPAGASAEQITAIQKQVASG